MNQWEDYFQILQVHVMAEPDMIKSAYLKLSKKYHPDINDSPIAQERMSEINRAYEVLCNPTTRRQYLMRWIEKYSAINDKMGNTEELYEVDEVSVDVVDGSHLVLNQYLQYLLLGEHKQAYYLLSDFDQMNISVYEFCHWQTLVAQVFELKSFHSILVKQLSDVTLNQQLYKKMTEYHVEVVEQNHIMEREEEDVFSKCVVCENGKWHIFLGHQQLNVIIQKFDELVFMKKSKKLRKEKMKVDNTYKNEERILTEVMTSLTEFKRSALKEHHRFMRHGNVFTLIKCEMRLQQSEVILTDVLQLIATKLRNLDNCCLWNPQQILILLPETNKLGAEQVVQKIIHAIEEQFGNQPLYYVVEEQRFQSLQELYETIFCQ